MRPAPRVTAWLDLNAAAGEDLLLAKEGQTPPLGDALNFQGFGVASMNLMIGSVLASTGSTAIFSL